MRAGLRPRLTFANVTSVIALVVAISGGAYAAITLPRNSVGPRQLRKNAVRSPKVKNHSLLAKDFKPGQLPRGATGLQGPQGEQGTQGAAGRDGAAVAARIRWTGSVETPGDGSQFSLPLTSNTWTQAPDEVDLLPYGYVKITTPDSTHCFGGGLADLLIIIQVDGGTIVQEGGPWPSDGSTHRARVTPTYMYEPGATATHTLTATFSSTCDAGPQPAPFTISELSFDVIRAL